MFGLRVTFRGIVYFPRTKGTDRYVLINSIRSQNVWPNTPFKPFDCVLFSLTWNRYMAFLFWFQSVFQIETHLAGRFKCIEFEFVNICLIFDIPWFIRPIFHGTHEIMMTSQLFGYKNINANLEKINGKAIEMIL